MIGAVCGGVNKEYHNFVTVISANFDKKWVNGLGKHKYRNENVIVISKLSISGLH